jgi:DNA-binding NarL/FixJ family response regulator
MLGATPDDRMLAAAVDRRHGLAPVRVLIVDSAASFRRGLGATLQAAGFEVGEAIRLPEESGDDRYDVVVCTIHGEEDRAALRTLAGGANPPLLVLLADGRDTAGVADALRVGVAGYVERDAEPALVVAAIEAARGGHVLVPEWAAAEFAARLPVRPPDGRWVRDQEVEWLRMFAAGATVAAVAQRVGYSEREMFRNLHDLYARIGVRNRTGALIWAERHGLLDAVD